MPVIPVAEWTPDLADLGSPGSTVVTNALPGANSYKPIGAHVSLTDATTNYPRGAIHLLDKDQNVVQYAGDETKLYELVGTSWSDISKVGGYSTATSESWDMVQWKNQVLATNWNENPQEITLSGAGPFADLTTDFRARRIAIVRDHVVVGNTFDVTDNEVPDRIRWSAFDDATDWTVSPTTGADYRDLKGGPIQRVFGGEFGVIFTETKTYRMDWVGAPVWFQISETLPEVGMIGPDSAARIGDTIYIWSNQGFLAIEAGTGFTPIGAGRVDQFALNDLDDGYLYRISAVADPKAGRIFWAYPGSGSTGGTPNKILCFDKNFNKWSIIENEVELLWRAGGIGVTLEGLDAFSTNIDTLGASLDSSQWKGDGEQLLAAFNTSNEHGFFSGSPLTATITTKEMEINAGKRTMLNAFRPLVDMGSVSAEVGTRSALADDVTYGSTLNQTSTGRMTTRSNARYHRVRMTLSGNWEDAIGVQIDQRDARAVGHRG
jgi:hypothetical protein